MKNVFAFGNHKLPKTIAIFNMSPYIVCPSLKLGLCQAMITRKYTRKGSYEDCCYAKVAEQRYNLVRQYRKRQMEFWDWCVYNWDTFTFVAQFIDERKVKQVKHLRFNQSGDFKTQEHLDFAICVAHILWVRFGIQTYGYTARKDLDFSKTNFEYFKFLGSGFHKEGLSGTFQFVETHEDVPEGEVVCPGDCHKCSLCRRVLGKTIYTVKHGRT